MQADDIGSFTALLAVIGEVYGKAISEFLVDIYWRAFQCFEWLDVHRAFQIHLHNPDGGQFFPKPADIIRILEGSGETKALQAWAKVTQAMVQVGVYQTVIFDDPLIHAVLEDMGGWIVLCAKKTDEMPFYAREFQKRYMGFVLKPPARYPKYCCGIFERDNSKNGYSIAPRCLLGDHKKAEQVLLNGGGQSLCVRLIDVVEQVVQPLLESMRVFPQSSTRTTEHDDKTN